MHSLKNHIFLTNHYRNLKVVMYSGKIKVEIKITVKFKFGLRQTLLLPLFATGYIFVGIWSLK